MLLPMPMSTEFTDRLEDEKSNDLMRVLENVGEKYGLTRFGYLADLRQPNAPAEAAPVIETNFPESWQERYKEKRYDRVDPLVTSGMRGFLPMDWSEISDKDRDVRNFFGEAKDFGLFNNGIGIPIRDERNRRAIFTVNTDMGIKEWRMFIRSHISDITYLGHLFHTRFAANHQGTGAQQKSLSEREQACLEWAARGKTSAETAMIMGVSIRTVDFHLSNGIRKLLAANKTQAVAIAVSEDLIRL